MSIIKNNLTKRFNESPESWLAKRIKGTAAVASIGYIATVGSIGDERKKKAPAKKKNPVAKKTVNKQKKKPVEKPVELNTELKSLGPAANIPALTRDDLDTAAALEVAKKEGNKEAAKEIVSKAAQGDLVGTVIAAIAWIISKLGGKKNKDLEITADDVPNVVEDNANAFEFKDLKEDYSNVPPVKQEEVKRIVTEVIKQDLPIQEVRQVIQNELPYLSPAQREEMVQEVEEGFEPTSEEADIKTAAQIKQQIPMESPSPSKGWCNW